MDTTDRRVWRRDISYNEDGTPYPVRTDYVPDGRQYTSVEAMDFGPDLLREGAAWHEAGHAVAAHHMGVDVHEVVLDNVRAGHGHARLGICAPYMKQLISPCGERAQDRWLREKDLWTPLRSVAVETMAKMDRDCFLSEFPKFGFGDKEHDYAELMDDADEFLDDVWHHVGAVARELLCRTVLTGDDVIRLCH